jgi:hypothetical protein
MSVRKIRRAPGQTGPIVKRGKPLDQSVCPICDGPTVQIKGPDGKPAERCGRCASTIVSKPF